MENASLRDNMLKKKIRKITGVFLIIFILPPNMAAKKSMKIPINEIR
jgi:hypothetical protein